MSTATMAFSPRQVADWRAFEKVRVSGAWNMFSLEAREAAGLRREECLFVIQHYAALKAAALESQSK
jgi:hypothetical protein